MKLMAVVVVLAVSGCSPAAWNHVDTATLIASDTMLTADAIFTLGAASERWSGYREEVGMARQLLGPTPSPVAVGVYFFGATVLNTALWTVLPPRWRSIVPSMVIGAQASALAWDYGGCRWCM